MQIPLGRRETVVLCGADGVPFGALPPLDLAAPWYTNVEDLVAVVRERFGLTITVLRLLTADRAQSSDGGGSVVHLARLDAGDPAAAPVGPVPELPAQSLAAQPLRARYAESCGARAELDWADRMLAAGGWTRTGPPHQVRTWNLSAIWRIPTTAGPVWLKSVPSFFAHEPAVLRLVGEATDAVPMLIAGEPGRVLLRDVPGMDLYQATPDERSAMVRALVSLQVAMAERVPDLLGTGAFDWRPPGFIAVAGDVVARTADQLDRATASRLDGLIDRMPDLFAAVAACGVPDTLVHGDFHSGNVRGGAGRLVMMDWGDAGVGHPLLDQAAFLETTPPKDRPAVWATWSRLWRKAVPGCDPDRAASLLAPVAALRQAAIYRLFLDNIEPSEWIYHESDPAAWLTAAAAAGGISP